MKRLPYPTDMSDAEWHRLAPLLPPPKPGGRPRTQNMREICNAIFYLLAAGCAWRMLPHDLPAWPTVYGYCHPRGQDCTWERINTALRRQVRVAAGREPEPSAASNDSQTVKTTPTGGEER